MYMGKLVKTLQDMFLKIILHFQQFHGVEKNLCLEHLSRCQQKLNPLPGRFGFSPRLCHGLHCEKSKTKIKVS